MHFCQEQKSLYIAMKILPKLLYVYAEDWLKSCVKKL